ncbi:MAG TPA: tetratricopeptide repeat protein [Candidatus Coprenecus stercoripullorum]|nr:tetratricopeptide repeat protein [Candidatus Coprenecus stercoripullorum]
MKRFATLLTVAVLAAFQLYAQDMESATQRYNEGAQALNEGNKEVALACFEDALSQAYFIGSEADELAFNCQKNIPIVIIAIAKDCINASDTEKAIAILSDGIKKAEEYGQASAEADMTSLLTQVYTTEGNKYLNAKDYAKAIESYRQTVELNPSDGNAWFRIGQAASRLEDEQMTVEALEKASELGQKANAGKELATFYLKRANKALNSKDYASAIADAEKSASILASAAAYQIGGRAAFNNKDYAKAIESLETYISKSSGKNVNQELYFLAISYETLGNKDKACGYYRQLMDVPQFKEYATHKVNVELKCQ